MTNGAPSPKEVFMYLDIVVEFQKRVVSSMDGVANRLHDQSTDLTRVTRALQQAREDQIDFSSEFGRRLDKVDAGFIDIAARFAEISARFTTSTRASPRSTRASPRSTRASSRSPRASPRSTHG